MNANIEHLHLVRQHANSVVVKDTSVRVKRTTINSLIFCMSAMKDATNCPFEGYNDSLSVPIQKANSLANRIGELILLQSKLDNFEKHLIKSHSPSSIKHLGINIRHQKVEYRDRTLNVTPKNPISYNNLVKLLSDIPFSKPTSFSAECEYRFIFDLVDQERIYPPVVDYVDLNLNLLANI